MASRIITLLAVVSTLCLSSCEKGYGAQFLASKAMAEQTGVIDAVQGFSIIDIRLVRSDGAIMDLTDRPLPIRLNLALNFSRGLSAEEKAQFERDFLLLDDETSPVSGRMEWSADSTELTFTPADDLDFGRTYTISHIRPVGIETSFKTMTCGDINGDGLIDFVVGAPGASNGMGKAYVYSGGKMPAPPLAEIAGYSEGVRMGTWVAAAGDVNGDGYADILVTEGDNRGHAHAALIFSGRSLARGAREIVSGARQPMPISPSVAVIRESKGVEVITGDPSFDSSRGKISIKRGSGELLAEMNGVSDADEYGAAVSPAGDVNGDGIADFAVGAPGALADTGAAYVYSGADLSGRPLVMRIADAAGDGLGSAVGGAGDLNGDGRDDVIAGAPEASEGRGVVHVFSGADISGSPLIRKTGERSDDAFGSAVAGVGDINGDSIPDILIGAPNRADGEKSMVGAVYVYSDTDRFSEPLMVLSGKSASENFGFSVASACQDPAKLGGSR